MAFNKSKLYSRPRKFDLPQYRRKHPQNISLLAAAIDYAKWAHEGERLKYVHDVYFTHPKAVSERMRTVEEKVVALLHDVVENRVAEMLGGIDPVTEQKRKIDPVEEEELIRLVLDEIRTYFGNCGFRNEDGNAADHIEDIVSDINMLTKRSTDTDYAKYIERVADYAVEKKSDRVVRVKMADLEDNSDPERNPPVANQKDKDRARLARYERAKAYFRERFPSMELRLSRADRHNYRLDRGQRIRRKLGFERNLLRL